MDDKTTPATGTYTTDGMPHDSTSITPHIVVSPGAAAIDFYRDVLGARVGEVTRMQGLVAHAELGFGTGGLTLSDPIPMHELDASDPTREATYSLSLYVRDVDGVLAAATAGGATVREPAATFVSGDRFASITDPFGVRWTLMTRVEDLSPAESARGRLGGDGRGRQ